MDPDIDAAIVRDQLSATETLWRLARIDGLTRAGLSKAISAYAILEFLLGLPERRSALTEIAQRLGLSRSNLTRMVDHLEREGLVKRDSKRQSLDRRITQ